jgi:hypothetical protein
MKPVHLVVTIASATLFAAAGIATASGHHTKTIRFAHPAGASQVVGGGTIRVRHTSTGESAAATLRGLKPSTTYEIVDGKSGKEMGTVRTNARGRAIFRIAGTSVVPTKAASTSGSDAGAGGDVPGVVDVVDPSDGGTVLTSDTTGTNQALYGRESMQTPAGSVDVTLSSDPSVPSQSFSFMYFAAPAADGSGGGAFGVLVDTSTTGVTLPIGASTVLDLAGKSFQVQDASGNVVFKGALPDVAAYAAGQSPAGGGAGGDWGGHDGWGGWGFGERAFEIHHTTTTSGDGAGSATTTPPATPTFSLWLQGADGTFLKAADLTSGGGGSGEGDDDGGGNWGGGDGQGQDD